MGACVQTVVSVYVGCGALQVVIKMTRVGYGYAWLALDLSWAVVPVLLFDD